MDLSLRLCVGDAPALLDPLRACVGSANAHAYEGGSIGERTERKGASPPSQSVSKIRQIRGAPQARIFAERGVGNAGRARGGATPLNVTHGGILGLQQLRTAEDPGRKWAKTHAELGLGRDAAAGTVSGTVSEGAS